MAVARCKGRQFNEYHACSLQHSSVARGYENLHLVMLGSLLCYVCVFRFKDLRVMLGSMPS